AKSIAARSRGQQPLDRVPRVGPTRRARRVTAAHPQPALEVNAMKAHTAYLTIHHPEKAGFVHLTPQVEEAVRKSGVREGPVLGNAMHITASVFVNDNESGLHHDFGVWLEKLAPFNPDPNVYHHNRTGEDNADAHLKRTIMGREVVVAVTN